MRWRKGGRGAGDGVRLLIWLKLLMGQMLQRALAVDFTGAGHKHGRLFFVLKGWVKRPHCGGAVFGFQESYRSLLFVVGGCRQLSQ